MRLSSLEHIFKEKNPVKPCIPLILLSLLSSRYCSCFGLHQGQNFVKVLVWILPLFQGPVRFFLFVKLLHHSHIYQPACFPARPPVRPSVRPPFLTSLSQLHVDKGRVPLDELPIWAFWDLVPWSSYWVVPWGYPGTSGATAHLPTCPIPRILCASVQFLFCNFLDQLIEIGSFQTVQPSTSINSPYLRDDICVLRVMPHQRKFLKSSQLNNSL